MPDAVYSVKLPADIRHPCTGAPAIDADVRELYANGNSRSRARMWLASYVVRLRKVHWRAGADWLYAHLLDGDRASNLSWRRVAGTASRKPYLFDANNVAHDWPASWTQRGQHARRIMRRAGSDLAQGPAGGDWRGHR